MQLNLTKSQSEFFFSNKKFCWYRAGVGAGKTTVGSVWSYTKSVNEPWALGLFAANTYRQLHNVMLPSAFRLFDDIGVEYSYNQQKGWLQIDRSRVLCVSLDNYDIALRGVEIGWAWVDELRDSSKAAWDVLIGRLRDRKAENLEIRVTSTPNGFDWMYELFSGVGKGDDYIEVYGNGFENLHLPKGYLESLKGSYDPKMYDQEVMGLYVASGTGQVYYGFDRSKAVKPVQRNPHFPVYIGMDFNINPMTAVAFQVYENNVYVVSEYYIMSSNTDELAMKIKADYGPLQIIPDSTGKALKTSSRGLSDHEILRQHGHIVLPTLNPARMDRYNTVNNMLDKGRLFVDPKCVKLIRDLEQVSFKAGTNEPDTSKDKTLTHISDALGYGVWFHFPIIKPSSGIYQTDR